MQNRHFSEYYAIKLPRSKGLLRWRDSVQSGRAGPDFCRLPFPFWGRLPRFPGRRLPAFSLSFVVFRTAGSRFPDGQTVLLPVSGQRFKPVFERGPSSHFYLSKRSDHPFYLSQSDRPCCLSLYELLSFRSNMKKGPRRTRTFSDSCFFSTGEQDPKDRFLRILSRSVRSVIADSFSASQARPSVPWAACCRTWCRIPRCPGRRPSTSPCPPTGGRSGSCGRDPVPRC